MTPVTRHTPMFRVWDPLNQTEDDAITGDRKPRSKERSPFEYGAHNAASAATLHAGYRFDREEGAMRSWPVTYRVRELDTGKLFDVSVDLDWEPRFTAVAEEIA